MKFSPLLLALNNHASCFFNGLNLSLSVCLNLNEAWAKRIYVVHFISKLTDYDGEINETRTSLDFAKDCGYIKTNKYEQCISECQEIGRMPVL